MSCRKVVNFALSMVQSTQLDVAEARDPEVIAMEIEQKLYDLCKNGLEYRSRVRSHIFNLRSKHNQTLRHLVLKGMITPSTFAEMKSEDMAPEGIRELREELAKFMHSKKILKIKVRKGGIS